MNAKRMLTNRWVLGIGAAALVAAAANVSLADPPRGGGPRDGRAGSVDRDRDGGGRGGAAEARGGFTERDRRDARPEYVDRGRDGRDRDGGRDGRGPAFGRPEFGRPGFGPDRRGDFGRDRPVVVGPSCRPPVVCGGVGTCLRPTYGTPAGVGVRVGPVVIIIR